MRAEISEEPGQSRRETTFCVSKGGLRESVVCAARGTENPQLGEQGASGSVGPDSRPRGAGCVAPHPDTLRTLLRQEETEGQSYLMTTMTPSKML